MLHVCMHVSTLPPTRPAEAGQIACDHVHGPQAIFSVVDGGQRGGLPQEPGPGEGGVQEGRLIQHARQVRRRCVRREQQREGSCRAGGAGHSMVRVGRGMGDPKPVSELRTEDVVPSNSLSASYDVPALQAMIPMMTRTLLRSQAQRAAAGPARATAEPQPRAAAAAPRSAAPSRLSPASPPLHPPAKLAAAASTTTTISCRGLPRRSLTPLRSRTWRRARGAAAAAVAHHQARRWVAAEAAWRPSRIRAWTS